MKLKVKAPAKINLFLKVGKMRKDGYHRVKTILQAISLYDEITLKKRKEDIKLKIKKLLPECRTLDKGKNNLIYKAANLFFAKTKIKAGAEITLEKNIPVGQGLGGGSSDAAAVLTGLNKLYKTGMDKKALEKLAAKIGTDVPFFISAGRAYASGRGEKIHPLLPQPHFWIVLVCPSFSFSTLAAYKRIDKAIKEKKLAKITNFVYNSFEAVIPQRYSCFIERVKENLRKAGAKKILMSGKGPAIFTTLKERRDANRIYQHYRRVNKEKVYIAKTLGG